MDVFCKMEDFLDGGISTADGDDGFILKKRCVAGAAVTDAGAGLSKAVFAGDTEFSVIASRGEDDDLGGDFFRFH